MRGTFRYMGCIVTAYQDEDGKQHVFAGHGSSTRIAVGELTEDRARGIGTNFARQFQPLPKEHRP